MGDGMMLKPDIARTPQYQQIARSLDLSSFLSHLENFLKQPDEDYDASSESETDLAGVDEYTGETIWKGVITSKQDLMQDKLRLYNLEKVGPDREWLQDVILSDSSETSDEEVTEEDLQEMLKEHVVMKKYRSRYYKNPKHRQYMYYSAGLLSNYDKFPEHQQAVAGCSKIKKTNKKDKMGKNVDADTNNLDAKIKLEQLPKIPKPGEDKPLPKPRKAQTHKKKISQSKTTELMSHRRRKLWSNMAKKEVGKVQRYKLSNHKDTVYNCKRIANYCMRQWRQNAVQSQKTMKEVLWRAKKLTREMQAYWKRFERVEREIRRRMEKEAEEQRRFDVELMEAKRQQRKLNFLITQTELYAHFMSRKLGGGSAEEQLRILNQLEEETHPRLVGVDDYDCEAEKNKLMIKVEKACTSEEERAKEFGLTLKESSIQDGQDKPQPKMFHGTLKGYQLKGMTWLVNLYDQGINGILADEMGLGKTVQSIAFLCHIAENYSVWGPFLIISPASTLHNWQQEMARFVPDFKVAPYWGNQQERKILRQFWDQKDVYTKEASFHVVITSYQLVITDIKYFNRIKWQYLILDEAQAIKSTTSMRWKLLLGFNCRNRLLLSGTPIQNSMAELWALLHFIMPSMFDSHDEFNEWFSKDIESHAEHKTSIDEKHLSRLHMILKPFMLRRVKTDVENELTDKIEIMVYCPLTTRQKMLYSALKKKIKIEDLLQSSSYSQSSQSITSNLMNLVMQFRKVCNHPELFERREPWSPFSYKCKDYVVPKLITEEGLINSWIPSQKHILYNILSIFAPHYIHLSLSSESNCFSFLKLLDMSPYELYCLTIGGLLNRWLHLSKIAEAKKFPWKRANKKLDMSFSRVPDSLVFTSMTEPIYALSTVLIHSSPETLEHRIFRSRKACPSTVEGADVTLLPEFPYIPRKTQILKCFPVTFPSFLKMCTLKVEISKSREMYSASRSWANSWARHIDCENTIGLQSLWYGSPEIVSQASSSLFFPKSPGGLVAMRPLHGWSNIMIPDKATLVTDAGKLSVLDNLLARLKQQGHRALIYSQMTKTIDLLEEYMWYRKHTYMRLDGSSKISDRRDMVADFQTRADIFVFLLSTRAGGLGINLTAADTVIFYDSDWNPTVDQQAMDRAHRLGQTKQVTVYRLICKGTIEERILQRAQEKNEIQRMVISGGNFKPDTLLIKPKEVVSLLLDDAEIEQKYRQKKAEKKLLEETRQQDMYREREKKRKLSAIGSNKEPPSKQARTEDIEAGPSTSSIAVLGSEEPQANNVEGKTEHQPAPKRTPQERSKSKRGRPPIRVNRGGLPRPPGNVSIAAGGIGSGIRRGPGRPRLKPIGPLHQGARGSRIGPRGVGPKRNGSPVKPQTKPYN